MGAVYLAIRPAAQVTLDGQQAQLDELTAKVDDRRDALALKDRQLAAVQDERKANEETLRQLGQCRAAARAWRIAATSSSVGEAEKALLYRARSVACGVSS